MTPKFDCVKSFMDTDAFHEFSTKYGLDSEIVASFYESFATYIDLPKEKWFKYHPPIEVKVVAPIKEPVIAKDETIIYNVDAIVPTAYIEKPHFPVRIKDHMLKLQLWFVRVILNHLHPLNKLKLNLVLLWLKISWLIILMGMLFIEAARIAKPDTKDKHRPIVGMPVVSVKIGDHCYHDLCDVGASVSAIPFTLYQEIMNDIAPTEIEILSHHLGLLEMLKSCVGKLNILLIFMFLLPHKMTFVPLYLVDPY